MESCGELVQPLGLSFLYKLRVESYDEAHILYNVRARDGFRVCVV